MHAPDDNQEGGWRARKQAFCCSLAYSADLLLTKRPEESQRRSKSCSSVLWLHVHHTDITCGYSVGCRRNQLSQDNTKISFLGSMQTHQIEAISERKHFEQHTGRDGGAPMPERTMRTTMHVPSQAENRQKSETLSQLSTDGSWYSCLWVHGCLITFHVVLAAMYTLFPRASVQHTLPNEKTPSRLYLRSEDCIEPAQSWRLGKSNRLAPHSCILCATDPKVLETQDQQMPTTRACPQQSWLTVNPTAGQMLGRRKLKCNQWHISCSASVSAWRSNL